MAKQYVLADHTFQDQGSGSFTAHQDLIRRRHPDLAKTKRSSITHRTGSLGAATGRQARDIGSLPRSSNATVRSYPYARPFPCFDAIRRCAICSTQNRVSWKFYAMPVKKYEKSDPGRGNTPGIWSAFDAIKAVRYSPEWQTNVTRTNLDFFNDISNRPAPGRIVDHAERAELRPSRVQSRRHAAPRGSPRSSTPSARAAIGIRPRSSIVWDDWGGLYDHVAPPRPRMLEGGPGFRVPMLIVSPYVKRTSSTRSTSSAASCIHRR